MGNEVAQASERKSLIITPFGTIFFHQPPAREEGVGGQTAQQVRSNWNQARGTLISGDRACVGAELYNLRFCSFISPGQRTNELWPAQCHLYLFSYGNFEIAEVFLTKSQGGPGVLTAAFLAQVGGCVPGERGRAQN